MAGPLKKVFFTASLIPLLILLIGASQNHYVRKKETKGVCRSATKYWEAAKKVSTLMAIQNSEIEDRTESV